MEEENAAKKLGGRRTYGKGVYYDENKKMHFRLEKQKDGSYKRVDMPNVTQVNKDGSWNVKKADGTTETREVVKGSGKQTVKLSKNGHRQYSVTVNGKTFTANASGVRFSDQVDAKNAKEKLQEQLRAQGYTNITIE